MCCSCWLSETFLKWYIQAKPSWLHHRYCFQFSYSTFLNHGQVKFRAWNTWISVRNCLFKLNFSKGIMKNMEFIYKITLNMPTTDFFSRSTQTKKCTDFINIERFGAFTSISLLQSWIRSRKSALFMITKHSF